jgi:hypothetical protein
MSDGAEFAGWFWSMVRCGGDSECWPWLGRLTPGGYGKLPNRLKAEQAHRVAFRLFNGFDAPKMVLHSCDNRPCCNPGHLREGSHQDNMDDMVSRGRSCDRRGERNTQAKLTGSSVAAIRASLAAGTTQRALAAEYGVSRGTIGMIATGMRWTDG